MTAKVTSGGELYGLRSSQDFQSAASYIRGRWPKAGVSFGVTDGGGMTAEVLTATIENALVAADEMAWFYPEQFSYLVPHSPAWDFALRAPRPTGRQLILHPHPGQSPTATPDFIAANAGFLGTNPFDGMTTYLRDKTMTLNATASINSSTPVSYDALMAILAPIRNIDLGNLKRNYAFVLGNSPPDVVNGDWSVVIQNWANLARACMNSGLKGIFFDNENYGGTFGHTPAGGDPARYADYAKITGQAVMYGILPVFPDIEILATHGPYVSYADALTALGANPGWAAANDLLGPFFEGMISALPELVPVPVPAPVPAPVVTDPYGEAIVDVLLRITAQLTRLNDTIEGALQRRNL